MDENNEVVLAVPGHILDGNLPRSVSLIESHVRLLFKDLEPKVRNEVFTEDSVLAAIFL